MKYLCELPLSRGVYPDVCENIALGVAVEMGHLEIVRFLCLLPRSRGVDLAADDFGAIDSAAFYGGHDMVSFLCRLGPVDGYPLDERRAVLERTVLHTEKTRVIQSVCSLPASVGLSTAQLRLMLCLLDDDSSAPATWPATNKQ